VTKARTANPVILSGALISIIGLGLPWFSKTTMSSETMYRPLTEPFLAPASIVLAGLFVAGSMLARFSSSVGLVGCISALVFNAAAFVWLFGAAVLAWLPSSVLPNNPLLSLEIGVSVTLVGALLVLVGVLSVQIDDTWSRQSQLRLDASFVVAASVAVGALVGRGVPLVSVSAAGFEWSLGAEQVPVIGDLHGLLGLCMAALALSVVILPRRALSFVLLVFAALFGALSISLVLAGKLLERGAEAAADQLGLSGVSFDPRVLPAIVGFVSAVGGAGLAIAVLRQQVSSKSFGAPVVDDAATQSLMPSSADDLPF
jgi:hypothetical protein